MLSLEQTFEIKASIIEYLKATFTFKDKKVERAFTDFIENPQNGMFKGPYISLRLPFIKADPDEKIPLDIKPSFSPFKHQIESFNKLSTEQNHNPEPTILTTGTGSGKTEAFLYPLLDYCFKNKEEKGVKAIILYPMNALATDQAKRIADTIYSDERLKNKLTAGLFIGEGRDNNKTYPDFMGPDHIIENRESILNIAPDILLTNFKMLDYALMRNNYHRLWENNLLNQRLLKFIVLDELHTYEGAQGSDVANLIRRLKLKLNIPDNHLCPIGTSATIGSGSESKTLLANFASTIFGEEFNETSVIEESRINSDAFFIESINNNFIPQLKTIGNSIFKSNEGFEHYIRDQLKLWNLPNNLEYHEFPNMLANLQIVRDVVKLCADGVILLEDLVIKLCRINKNFSNLPEYVADGNYHPRELAIRSILSLISVSKIRQGDREYPFLYLQSQLWIRELSGIVRVVKEKPVFKWREDIDIKNQEKGLPVFYCRECGASGWIAEKHANRQYFESDINEVYEKYFSNNRNIFFTTPKNSDNQKIDEYEPTDTIDLFVNKKNLSLNDHPDEDSFNILAYRKLSNNYNIHICPQCNTKNTLNIIGSRVSTLASVSTSQLLATDLDSTPEKKRKILAFSNGVQDAAHRAGYIGARNYRFTFRTALQNVINNQDKPINLIELQSKFIEYWTKNADETGEIPLESYFYKFFPSDHAGDIKIKDFRKGKERFDDKFMIEFSNRVSWEIFSEFGYNAIIGRTLEKTFSSGTFFTDELLRKSYLSIKEWLDENTLGNIDENSFVKFILIFLHRLRIRGGLDHVYLRRFRTGRSSYYLITQNTNPEYFLIRNFGKNTRLPKFITNEFNTYGVFDLTTRTAATNWFHAYFTKAFPLSPNNTDLVNDFYNKVLDILASTEIDLLDKKEAQGIPNFAIKPDKLFITPNVSSYVCDVCGNVLNIGKQNEAIMSDAKCISFRCTGKYLLNEESDFTNYYQQVYNRGRAPRIYAADHTGLLNRRDRETLEYCFKNRPKQNCKNVLVATSTLEMGIDIGDLNSAINTSVPPMPSNFMQRIGRAGRSSGSAVIINFATNESHDLYYFEDPNGMMQGEINTPGCYLDAKEILKRHFFAFCIDSWTSSNPITNDIPPIIRFIKLDSLISDDPAFFINKILDFIKSDESNLFNKFKNAFRDKISQIVFDELKSALRNNSFYEKPKKIFIELKNEILHLKNKLQQIRDEVSARNLAASDPERLELEREFRNISNTILLIRRRSVLEHLTNEGVLPNYAFPETGVTLKALIRRKNQIDTSKSELKTIELVRPARSAIRELVPDNSFYSQGYKMGIGGLSIVSWREEILTYRYCSKCDHIDLDYTQTQERCPKCGDESWRSDLNRHNFIKLKAVNSFNDELKSKLDDSSEERESKFSSITRHFKFFSDSMQGSWSMINIPFGIEYFKNVHLMEVNTGLRDSHNDGANNTVINSKEVSVNGFIVCRHCGKSTGSIYKESNTRKTAADFHYAYCNKREQIFQGHNDEVFEQLFLFRNIETEALRILIPVQEFNTESAISMFKAGISLGLKKYYRGNPDHIDIKEYTEFNQKTQRNDRYLILYDTIPGGTGYLGKLFDKDEFNLILKYAYENIRDCGCQYTGRDGCYKCIFTYANKFERESLSRVRAEKIFEKICKSIPDWEYSESGLSNLTKTGRIEESELEERFISVISQISVFDNSNIKLTPKTEDGITYYRLEILKPNKKIIYEIRPQVSIGRADGVEFTTRADFMIYCISFSENESENDTITETFKPIAVYLDGYQYHASEYNNIFKNDILKRYGIIKSGRYITWTLTWEDLDKFDNQKNDKLSDILSELNATITKVKSHPLSNNQNNPLLGHMNNMARLLWYLINYKEDILNPIQLTLYSLQTEFAEFNYLKDEVLELLDEIEMELTKNKANRHLDGLLYLDAIMKTDNIGFRIFKNFKNLSTLGKIYIKTGNDSYSKEEWNYFWVLFNLLQFDYQELSIELPSSEKVSHISNEDIRVNSIYNNFDEKYAATIDELIKNNIQFDESGYFSLSDINNTIIAEAIIGSSARKFVIDPLDDNSKRIFTDNNYIVFNLSDFKINKLK